MSSTTAYRYTYYSLTEEKDADYCIFTFSQITGMLPIVITQIILPPEERQSHSRGGGSPHYLQSVAISCL